MKPRVRPPGSPLLSWRASIIARPAATRQSSSSAASSQSPPKQQQRRRQWLRLSSTLIALTVGIGAYAKWQQDLGETRLNPFTFTKYYLVSKEPVSSTCSILTLKPPKSGHENRQVYEEAWRNGVWSVLFKQPQLQVGRDYTPLPATSSSMSQSDNDGHDGSLRFLIRRDPQGEVSRYLHSLDIGTAVEIRGPQTECVIPPAVEDVLFIAGGTGIAPALQAGHTLLRRTNGAKQPRIHILWANRRREDCIGGHNDTKPGTTSRSWLPGFLKSRKAADHPPQADRRGEESPSYMVREIENLKSQYPGQITVDYFVDEENTFVGKNAIVDFARSAGSSRPPRSRKLILVSGPAGFVSYMAGPKVWAQGMELQGPLQGVVKDLNLTDWAVWKL